MKVKTFNLFAIFAASFSLASFSSPENVIMDVPMADNQMQELMANSMMMFDETGLNLDLGADFFRQGRSCKNLIDPRTGKKFKTENCAQVFHTLNTRSGRGPVGTDPAPPKRGGRGPGPGVNRGGASDDDDNPRRGRRGRGVNNNNNDGDDNPRRGQRGRRVNNNDNDDDDDRRRGRRGRSVSSDDDDDNSKRRAPRGRRYRKYPSSYYNYYNVPYWNYNYNNYAQYYWWWYYQNLYSNYNSYY